MRVASALVLAAALAAECATAPILLWRFNLAAAGAWLTAPLSVPLSGGLIGLGAALLLLYAAGLPTGPLPSLFALGSRTLEWMAERAGGIAFLRPTPPLPAVVLVGGLLAAAGLAPRRVRPFAAIAAAVVGLTASALVLWCSPYRDVTVEGEHPAVRRLTPER